MALVVLVSTAETVRGQPSRILYKINTELGAPVHASPRVRGSTVYYSTLEPDCAMYGADAATGRAIWRYQAYRRDTTDPRGSRCGVRASARLSADGSVIHAGTDNNTFFALHTADGSALWNYSAPTATCVDGDLHRPCEVYSTALLVACPGCTGDPGRILRIEGSEDGNARAFDAATGALIWRVEFGAEVNGSPVVNPSNSSEIIIGVADSHLHCLAIATGDRCGVYPSCGEMDTEPSVDSVTGTLFFTCYIPGSDPSAHSNGMIAALDTASGQLRWKLDKAVGVPTFVDGVVYAGLADGSAVALNASNGSVIWRNNQLPADREFFGALMYDGVRGLLYGGNLGGYVVAIDAVSGKLVWSVDIGGHIANNFGPAVSEDNSTLWMGTYDGSLVAVSLK